MIERGILSHAAFLRNARNSEKTLRKEAIERTDLRHLKDTSRLISPDTTPVSVYQVESTGAVVSLNSAVGLIHFYYSQLPSYRYSILHPEFIMERHEKPGVQLNTHAGFNFLAPPVIVFSSACAGLAGEVVPAVAQLAASSYRVAVTSPSLRTPDKKIQKSTSSPAL